MNRETVGLGAVALLLTLAGCTPAPQPGSAPSPAPSASVGPTSAPTPTVDPADPSAWVIGFGSIGPLRVGGTIADAGSALASFAQTEDCPGVIMLGDPDVDSVVVPVGDDDVIDQLVVWLDSANPPVRLRTAAGIALGSTEADLVAAYPGIIGFQRRDIETVYSVADGSGYFIHLDVYQGIVNSIATRREAYIDSEYCG